MDNLEISSEAQNVLTMFIPIAHMDAISCYFQDELFEMFNNAFDSDDDNDSDSDDETYRHHRLIDNYKCLIYQTLQNKGSGSYDELMSDFDENVRGYDYVKICEELRDNFHIQQANLFDPLDYHKVFELCVLDDAFTERSFDRFYSQYLSFIKQEKWIDLQETFGDADTLFNTFICRKCKSFDTYETDKKYRWCDKCIRPKIIKIQAIIRGHNQRWKCPILFLKD